MNVFLTGSICALYIFVAVKQQGILQHGDISRLLCIILYSLPYCDIKGKSTYSLHSHTCFVGKEAVVDHRNQVNILVW